jgi:hypothetical protein
LLFILGLGLILAGCKKETPPPQALTAKEKAFLSASGAVTCTLEKIKISKIRLSDDNLESYIIRKMEQLNRHFIKQGQITLVNRPFKIILGFHPEREFFLYDIKKKFSPYWSGSRSLYSYHKIDDTFYEFMLIENGTKIAARPYKGELGIIKVGKGGRTLEKAEFSGSFQKEDDVAVPAGTIKENQLNMVTESEIPVGDYKLSEMYVTYDNLLIRTSDNTMNAQDHSHRKDVYCIQVRQDKPYVLNFSNEPMILTKPDNDQTTFKRGEEIQFTTKLIDPKLNVKIWGLEDTSIKVKKEFKDRDGNVFHTAKVNKSLDPKIVITRADGEVVAEGVMPFG